MFLRRLRADDGTDRSPWGDFWFTPVGARSMTGQRVGADTAMRLGAVFACVRVLAETVATLPFVLYRKGAGGRKEYVTDHWLYRLISRRPNRYQDAFQWREMMQGHLALRGNAYNEIIVDGRGEITELVPLHPDHVKPEILTGGGYRWRVKNDDGTERTLAPGMVFRLAGLSSNGLTGVSPLELARDAIGLGLAAQEYGARFFANDARPLGGWIEFPGRFKDQAAAQSFRENWQKSQAGANRGKTAVLQDGMKYHEIGLNNRDSQFLELRNAQIADIARFFRVPPHLIGDLSRSTNNNIEHQGLEFVLYTMTPIAERWEAAIEAQLLTDDDGLEVEFDMGGLLRGDHQARAAFYASGINAGWLTRNEARIDDNRDPLEGLDEPLQPVNMVEAGSAPQPAAPGLDDGAEPPSEDGGEETARRLQAMVEANADRLARRFGGTFAAPVDQRNVRAAIVVIATSLAVDPVHVAAWFEDEVEGRQLTEDQLAAALRRLGAVK